MASITTLEKSVEKFAEKLRAKGHEVEVYVFRSGQGGVATSYVEINVDDFKHFAKFIAGEYSTHGHGHICGDTWTEMKKEFEEKMI